MSKPQTLEGLDKWLRDRHISEIECLVPDMTGNVRGKIIPEERYNSREGIRLPEDVFAQTVTGEWPEDYSMFDETERDTYLKPDPATARVVPWATEPTAQIIHDCFNLDGSPLDLAPRTVLKKVLAAYKAEGLTPIVAPELEFFLVEQNTDPEQILKPPLGRNGRRETARQSFSIDAVNEFDPIFEEMYQFCEAMDLDIDTLIHESGAAQMEVNFLHADAVSRADQVTLFKRTLREVAYRHGVYATFMAKPMASEPGSSMHIHQSVLDSDGNNIFAGEDGGNSERLLHFIGGLQKYVPYAMAFFAPNVNSYRRICREVSAPINVQWGYDNRTVGLRVPMSEPDARRIENRFAGADANPYLAMAATLSCGLLGLREQLEPSSPLDGCGYDLDYAVPRSLEEALRLLRECEAIQDMLGERFVRAYAAIKETEYDTFFQVISSWEREFLLLNV